MDISEYLKDREITQAEFARQLGVTPGLVWQWLNGETKITGERAVEIEQHTGGAVRREALRPDLFGRESRA